MPTSQDLASLDDGTSLMVVALPFIGLCWWATNKAMDGDTEMKAKMAILVGASGLAFFHGLTYFCEGKKTGVCQFGMLPRSCSPRSKPIHT